MTNLTASQNAVDLIKAFEGLSLIPYSCPAGHATIGYGHKIHNGKFDDIVKKLYSSFAEEDAERLLKEDIAKCQVYVQRQVPAAVNQNQFDALVSLAYNIPAALATGTGLSLALGAHDWEQAGEQILRWHHIGAKDVVGLLNRRIAEKALFARPFYDT